MISMRIRIILLTILIVIGGNIIYIYPKLDSISVPTNWGPGIDWGRFFIVNQGKIYERQENALTWQSDIIRYGSIDLLPKILYAIINIITGTIQFPNDISFHYLFPWIGTIFLPLVSLYWYRYLYKATNKRFNEIDFLLILLYSIFPIASSMQTVSGNTNGSGLTRVLFTLLLILVSIIFMEGTRQEHKYIILFLLLPFYSFYHTWSYYMVFFLITIIISILTVHILKKNILSKNEERLLKFSFFGIIVFIISAIYYNTVLFSEPIDMIKNFDFSEHAIYQSSKFSGYETLGNIYSYIQVVNSTLILIIFIIFLLYNRNYDKNIFLYYIIAEFMIAIGLFIWMGISGVYLRIFETLTYISMLISTYLLIMQDGKIKMILRYVLLFAAILSIVSYLNLQSYSNVSLTDTEFKGIIFTGSKIQNDTHIFSDFRLTTPLVYFGQLGITTIDNNHQPFNVTEEILQRIYYNTSKPEIILDKIIHRSKYYIITSSRQNDVCIFDPSSKCFKHANANFQKELSHQSSLNLVYFSGNFSLFSRKEKK